MKTKSVLLMSSMLAAFLFFMTHNVHGQRLYNEDQDKKAQEAAKQAKDVTSSATFENQLKNLDTFSKRDSEVYFRGAKRQMALEIGNLRTWGRVAALVDRVQSQLEKDDLIPDGQAEAIVADLKTDCPRTTDLGKAICKAQGELDKAKLAVAASDKNAKALKEELDSRLETIGNIKTLAQKAEEFLKSDSKNNKVLKGFTESAFNLATAYANFNNKLAVINNEPNDQLKFVLQQIAVQALQTEADHWKAVNEIKQRRDKDQEELASIAREFKNGMATIVGFYPCLDPAFRDGSDGDRTKRVLQERLDVTFAKVMPLSNDCNDKDHPCCLVGERRRSRESITIDLFRVLHLASALSARGATPSRLADLRLAQESHRYSIRVSAVIARGYELVLTSGTERLARYYAGGLKPEKIAQLIYTAATVAIPGVIAGK